MAESVHEHKLFFCYSITEVSPRIRTYPLDVPICTWKENEGPRVNFGRKCTIAIGCTPEKGPVLAIYPHSGIDTSRYKSLPKEWRSGKPVLYSLRGCMSAASISGPQKPRVQYCKEKIELGLPKTVKELKEIRAVELSDSDEEDNFERSYSQKSPSAPPSYEAPYRGVYAQLRDMSLNH
ncbi:hypothetical protein 2 [Beihai rhabdo-like virus 3]|uniref:Uncharacterized protein n=1 Tax=Beihai rhabdo-like virus 3 TaxID=1922653 RepID=A0A1L3KMP3_9MONO|nr:hypothetical protein 2 [Beihai rhabdo-like virus 3]APG78652.1 hypothetical protein 2 [Beihai rhabdo-like virus 3]